MTGTEQKITCPKCGAAISIDEALTHQIEESVRTNFEADHQKKEAEINKKKKELDTQALQLEEDKKSHQIEINKKVAERLATEKVILWKQAQVEAGKEKEAEKKLLEAQLAEKDEKLRKANEQELALRQEKNKLEEDKRNLALEVQRRLDQERGKITEDAKKQASEEQQYQIAQLRKQLSDATKAKDELARKLEQGSQQTQGEVLELELEEVLKTEFPRDEIAPVPKGVKGADVVQKVFDRSGRLCGQIVWESKKTKAWSNGWVQKLKDDQRAIKAELAVIVSIALPDDIKGFAFRDGVWICSVALAPALGSALRVILESVTREKTMSVGKNEKMEVLYTYLTGVEFRQRVEAIVEAFTSMGEGLQKEKLAYEKIWAEREKQIKKVINNTVGMYGDLSGLVTLPTIKTLELPTSEVKETKKE